MQIEDIVPLVNTAILLGIFLYQKNKNKVLVDRIEHQQKLLSETKGIVLQQSTAIDSQGKVVDTAIKYSEAFSPDKLEKLIRKEVDIEQKEEREKLASELRSRIKDRDKRIELLEKKSQESQDLAQTVTSDMLPPLMETLVKVLILMSDEERSKVLDEMKEGASKEMLISVLRKVEAQMMEMISNKSIQPNADASAD